MTETKKPAEGERFNVQIFWLAHMINGRINRIAFGPFVDWPAANKARQALSDASDHLIMRTESEIIVDDERDIVE